MYNLYIYIYLKTCTYNYTGSTGTTWCHCTLHFDSFVVLQHLIFQFALVLGGFSLLGHSEAFFFTNAPGVNN